MVRFLFTWLFIGIFASLQAQNLTGKWVGYFTTNTGITYPYEINIQDDGNANLSATTLTKFAGNNLAKALAKGIFTKQSKLASIDEIRFEQISLAPHTQACLMNNYLTYSKLNGKEVLQGTYMSNNLTGTSDCGNGMVLLTKEIVFLVAKKTNKSVKTSLQNKDTIGFKKDTINTIIADNSNLTKQTELIVQNAAPLFVQENKLDSNSFTFKENHIPKDSAKYTVTKAIKKPNFINVPWVLISRDNKLIKHISSAHHKISIDLFDNGSFDSDSVSIYDNNVLLYDRIKLSYKEFHFELPLNDEISKHELVLVANKSNNSNRNSCILVYKDNALKEEFIVTISNKNNAKLLIQYDSKLSLKE